MVEQPEEPAAVAGHVLAAAIGRTTGDPLEPMLRNAGLPTTLRLLTTGAIPTEVLRVHAATLVRTAPPRAGASELAAAFEQAQVRPGPWLGEIGRPAALDPLAGLTFDAAQQILNDGDWVSLQNICRR